MQSEAIPTHPRFHPNVILLPGLLFGIAMILVGILLRGGIQKANLADSWYPTDNSPALELGIGSAAGVLGILIVWGLTQRFAALKRLREKLVGILRFEELRWWHALAFGLLAGIPEEILFRGAIQPLVGIWLAALLFGALHSINAAYFGYATLAGVCLGLLAAWRGDLWAATAAHFVYDGGMFWLIGRQVRKG